MMKYDTQFPSNQKQVFYDKNERTIITINGNNRSRSIDNSSNSSEMFSYNQNARLNNSLVTSNGGSMSGTLLKINTKNYDDDTSSLHTSTFNSTSPTSPPVFHLVRKSSMYAPRVEAPRMEQLKVDIYSVGVIMKSKMRGAFDPELFKVEAIAPTGRVIKITGDGQYAAQFTADEIGSWKVAMYYNGKYLDGCPVDVCDPSQVKVHDLKGGIVGKDNTFFVDCTRAGPGDLGVDITHEGQPVPAHISSTKTAKAHKMVAFTPHAPGAYEINIHFNRAEVREGDLGFFNPDERKRKAVFFTRVEPHQDYIEVKASCDWEIDYITGWPFICHVTDSSDIAVYGMQDGTVCTNPEMIADCTHVGDGQIDAEVSIGGRRYPCNIVRDKPGMYRVQFKPRGQGVYKVWINYEGRPVKGSPFLQEIAELEKPTATGDGLYRGVLGKPTSFIIDTRGFPGQVSVAVKGHSKSVSVQLEPQTNNTIRAVYVPEERGLHFVYVKIDGRDIKGSPYRPLIVDPLNVRVSGGWRTLLDERGIMPLRVSKEKHLPFDVSEAGQGELAGEVQGPNGKIPVTIDARNDGRHSVIFTPREEGRHHIHVTWSGFSLTNSPYLGYATYEPELEEHDNIRLVHVPIQFHERSVHMPVQPLEHSVHIPVHFSERSVHSPVQPLEHSVHIPVHFPERSIHVPVQPERSVRVPVQPERSVRVPVQFPERYPTKSPDLVDGVYPRTRGTEADPHKHIKIVYRTPEPTNRPQEPNYRLPEIILSPAKPQTVVEAQPRNTEYTHQEPTHSDQPQSISLVGSTWPQPISPGGSQKVTLRGKGLKEAEVDKLAHFTVDGVKANPGKPMAYLESVQDHIPVTSEPVRPGVYKCTYVPRKPGAYLLYINWNDKPLKGSPFKVNIRGVDSKPEKIKGAEGKPLNVVDKYEPGYSTLGSDLEMKIDPKYSATGKLKVKCTDPMGTNVPCQLKENLDGVRSLKITPKVAGRHFVEIQYNGSHIMGSPYVVNIRENHSKGSVRVWGPGIESGIIPYFQSTFWVDTTGAGPGDIRVRIVGPKGAFHVKLRKSSQTDKIYQCFYDPVEPGIYTVIIQWSGIHVGGSPFQVLLANSTRELQDMQDDFIENSIINGDDSSVITQRVSKYQPPQEVSVDDIILY